MSRSTCLTNEGTTMKVEPQKQHHWLKKLVGEWAFEHEASMGPGKPPETFRGNERVRALGDVWVLCDGEGQTPGGGVGTSMMTLGYDTQKKQFVGSFVGSMMTNLWVYDSGSLDAAEKALTLEADGPDFTEPGKVVRYRDVIEFKSDDHRTLTSATRGADGKWNVFMTAHYRRTK